MTNENTSCDCNEINGVTVAVLEELSPVARIRLELAAVDEAMDNDSVSVEQYNSTLANLVFGISGKLHTLLDTIDTQAKELEALKIEESNLIDALEARDWYSS